MAKSKRIVYLTSEQYAELVANETITVDGVTVTYNDTDIYVTPQTEPVTDVQINGQSIVQNGVANVPVVSPNAINDKADIIVSSASGAIASFSDGADAPVKSLAIGIEPVQDLHGYDHPWPAGGGKNLLLCDAAKELFANGNPTRTYQNNGLTIKATSVAAYYVVLDVCEITESMVGKTYVSSSSDTATLGLFNTDTNTFDAPSFYITTKTIASSDVGLRLAIRFYNDTGADKTWTDCQVELGSTATTFAPYSNVCPISGWDAANVTRTGKNVWDEEWDLGSINSLGQIQTSTTRIKSKNFIDVKPETEYRYYNAASISSDFFYYKDDGTFISSKWITTGTSGTSKVFTTPPLCTKIKFNPTSGYGATYNHDISINYPSTDTAYHPGHVQIVPIEFPSLAGTVYGGQLTVNEDGTGTLMVDMGEYTFTGNEAWHASSTAHRFYVNVFNTYLSTPIAILKTGTDDEQNAITSVFGKCIYKNADGVAYFTFPSNEPQFVVNEPSAETIDDIKAIVAGTQLVYELATPLIYTLTASQVTTLLGVNNIWADTGDATVTYRADTKLYIDNKITQAIAAALNA